MLTFSVNDKATRKMNRFISVYPELAKTYGADVANDIAINDLVKAKILKGNEFINLRYDEKDRHRKGKLDLGADLSDTDESRFNMEPIDVYADVDDDLLIAHIRADLFSKDTLRYSYGHFGLNLVKTLFNPFAKARFREGSSNPLRATCISGKEAILQLLSLKGYDTDLINKDKFVAMLLNVRDEYYPASV